MLHPFFIIISTILGFFTGYSVIRFIMFPLERQISKNTFEMFLKSIPTKFMPNETIATDKYSAAEKNKFIFHLKYSVVVFLFDTIIFKYGNLTAFWIGFAVSAAIFIFFIIFILRFFL